MPKEQDLSNAEQGEIFLTDTTLQRPANMEPEVLSYFTDKVKSRSVVLNAKFSELLKKDSDLIGGIK